ncbi:hypothetical protein EI613_03450 [Azospirillum sp. 412522]|nr:hypothetical protein [Azospirillum sp. 412522]MBY6260981.1 hypothetical protein [Azospirillum sp. 412522]
MQSPDDFDRMVMASLGPPGALAPSMLPPPDQPEAVRTDAGAGRGILSLGLGIAAAILLASLASLA